VRHALHEAIERVGQAEVDALLADWEMETTADLEPDEYGEFISQLNDLE
jgi:hypothetical protein